MKRALVVGVDHYPPEVGSLTGCVADATAMRDLLTKNADGSPNWSVQLVSGGINDKPVLRETLREALAKLFKNPRELDLLFYFAGHGGQTAWGADLVTQDATEHSLGVSMNDLLTLANNSAARSVTIILDCCFGGDTGSVPGLQSAGIASEFRFDKALLRENVTIMTASRGTETSAEFGGHGAFTRVLLDGLEGGATDHRGTVSALNLYSFVSAAFNAWEQRPLLKTSLTQPVVLRVGPPWLEPALLRQLPEHFPTKDARLQLTPAHEGEGRPLTPGELGTAEQQQFDYVGRLRNANLVTTDNDSAHYWVAMNSGYVYLTKLGQYFWSMAERGDL